MAHPHDHSAPGGARLRASTGPAASWAPPLAAGVIVLATVGAYLNSFHGPFIFDDNTAILESPSVRSLWPIWRPLFPPHEMTTGGRPIANLTLAINYAFGGTDVRGYHAANLAIHVAAALVLFGIVRWTLLLPSAPAGMARRATVLAFAAALLWALHPIHTSAVTYIVQRVESLMGLFYLLTVYCAVRAAASRRPRAWGAAAVVACGLGMGSKEVMVTAPVFVLLYDRAFLSGSFRLALRRRWPLYLGLAATWGVLALCMASSGDRGGTVGFGIAMTPFQYARTQPGVILHYLRLAFWPAGLCLDYYWPVAGTFGQIAPGAAVVGGLLALTAWGLVRRPQWGVLGAWFFLVLAPTSSIVPLENSAFEYRMYLPLAAVAAAAVLGGHWLWEGFLSRWGPRGGRIAALVRAAPAALLVAAAIALGAATWRRNGDYRSELSIWRDTVEKSPLNARAHNNLGAALFDVARHDEAMRHFDLAVRLNPNDSEYQYNLGLALATADRRQDAVRRYEQAIRLDSGHAQAHHNLGNLLATEGRSAEAIRHLGMAVRLKPDNAEFHFSLGNVLAGVGRLPEAIGPLGEAVRLKPDDAQFRVNLGNALAAVGRQAEAIRHYEEALRLGLESAVVYNNLAWALATREQGTGADRERAVAMARRANELSGGPSASLEDTLAAALAAAGRFPEAIQAARKAVDLASAAGQAKLAREIEARLELYRAGRPYRQGAAPVN